MDIKLILSYTRRAVDSYSMIEDGDRIAVGISGGKDSLTLLCALAHLKKFYPKSFDIVPITIDMGFEGTDYSGVEALCREFGLELKIVKTQISQIIFDVRKEDSPCSLCSRMRRGALNDAADEYGCNKVALGHHMDDVIETYMLNLFYAGRVGTFSPVTYLDRSGITNIRPLIYVPEKDIRYFSSKENLPVFKNKCRADGNTERENMKKRITELQKEIPDIKNKIFGAIQRAEISGFHPLKK